MLIVVILCVRYSPNYVPPLKTAQYDNDEILDYTGSPHHCVATTMGMVNSSKWHDDSQRSQLNSQKFHPPHSPDPWAVRRQAQNINKRDHVYKVAIDFTEADSSESSALCQVTTSKAGLTTCEHQRTTSTITSSITESVAKQSNMG